MVTQSELHGLGPAALRSRLGDDFATDLADLVPGRLDIDVVVLNLVGAGYLLVVGRRPVIVAKLTPNWFFQNFSIAHELGHLAYDSLCGQPLGGDAAERAANQFAAELLMPESQIRSIDWDDIDLPTVADRVWHWGVSAQALRTRLNALGATTRGDILNALSGKTQALLRRHWQMPPGADPITGRMMRASERRFPNSLISRLETAVTMGNAPTASLAFALGVDENDLETDVPEGSSLVDDALLLEGLI